MSHHPQTIRGYVALITVLIIAALLVLLAFVSSTYVYLVRFSEIDAEHQREARLLADSCVSVAILRIAQNPTYRPSSDVIQIEPGHTCTIDRIEESESYYTTSTHATVGRAQYNSIALRAKSKPP